MNSLITNNRCKPYLPMKILSGIEGLEKYLDRDTFLYVLRKMYGLVSTAEYLKETKYQLQQWISEFEQDANLPHFLSSLPIDVLLRKLEDAQYIYPMRIKEFNFPTLH